MVNMVLRRPSWLGKGGRREDEEDQDEEGEGGGLEGGDHGRTGRQVVRRGSDGTLLTKI